MHLSCVVLVPAQYHSLSIMLLLCNVMRKLIQLFMVRHHSTGATQALACAAQRLAAAHSRCVRTAPS